MVNMCSVSIGEMIMAIAPWTPGDFSKAPPSYPHVLGPPCWYRSPWANMGGSNTWHWGEVWYLSTISCCYQISMHIPRFPADVREKPKLPTTKHVQGSSARMPMTKSFEGYIYPRIGCGITIIFGFTAYASLCMPETKSPLYVEFTHHKNKIILLRNHGFLHIYKMRPQWQVRFYTHSLVHYIYHRFINPLSM